MRALSQKSIRRLDKITKKRNAGCWNQFRLTEEVIKPLFHMVTQRVQAFVELIFVSSVQRKNPQFKKMY